MALLNFQNNLALRGHGNSSTTTTKPQYPSLLYLCAFMNTRGSSPCFTASTTPIATLCNCLSRMEIGPKITSGLSSNFLNSLRDPIRFLRCLICGGTQRKQEFQL